MRAHACTSEVYGTKQPSKHASKVNPKNQNDYNQIAHRFWTLLLHFIIHIVLPYLVATHTVLLALMPSYYVFTSQHLQAAAVDPI